jgi:hypothetical protein
MRKAFGLGLVLLASACGQAPNRGDGHDGGQATASNEAAEADMAAPGIAPTAAPGVAFNYKYAFRLPAERISGVQEQRPRPSSSAMPWRPTARFARRRKRCSPPRR